MLLKPVMLSKELGKIREVFISGVIDHDCVLAPNKRVRKNIEINGGRGKK
jgi:hypothetical protein